MFSWKLENMQEVRKDQPYDLDQPDGIVMNPIGSRNRPRLWPVIQCINSTVLLYIRTKSRYEIHYDISGPGHIMQMITITSVRGRRNETKRVDMRERGGWKHGMSNEDPFKRLAAVTGPPLQTLVQGLAGATF